ncbi:MAG: helix-turn-helix domain-containing protein [Alphaproteobacteria bacterium]|nr:helix-turn-helix domain-containing protein [Alphaproteobacteria bacterium]
MIHSAPPNERELAPLVRSIWSYRCEPRHNFETLLPHVGGQLLVNLHGSELRTFDALGNIAATTGPVALHGIRTERIVIDTEQKRNICGVEFEPGGLTAFTDWSARRFRDRLIDASDVWGADSRLLHVALVAAQNEDEQCGLLESFLAGKIIHRPAEDASLGQWIAGLQAGGRIQDIQNALGREGFGMSQRQLHALFDRRLGVRPKLFARLVRLSSSVAEFDQSPSFASLAYEHGYADQSHLTREFRQLAGTTPRAHRPIDGEPNHVEAEADKMFKTGERRRI